jgi:FKBP-type peptidyl-prolyl cis-trans isomerase FkpA
VGSCTTEPGVSPTQSTDAGTQLETEDQKTLYALGQWLGQNVEDAALSEDEISAVFLGLSDRALGREPRVDMEQYGSLLPLFMQRRLLVAAEAALVEATGFVDEQAQTEGAIRTESGMVIQEIEAGTGARPAADDTVTVHYHGTLPNGRVFDSSVERGEPATFPLSGVIPCWTEGVQTIQAGGKSRLICPPDLAYGPGGVPGIPGNSALVFEVELVEISQEQ